MVFKDPEVQATHDAFILGMRVAEYLNGLKPGGTADRKDFVETLLGIVNGEVTVIESALDVPPVIGQTPEESRRIREQCMRRAAKLFLRVYDREEYS